MELDLSQPKVEEEERYFWPIYQKVMVHLATPAPSSDHCTAQFYILIMPISLPYYIFHDTDNRLSDTSSPQFHPRLFIPGFFTPRFFIP